VFSSLSLVIVLSLPAEAQAECDVGPGNVGLSFIWPEQDCQHNIHADLRWGLYKSSGVPMWQTEIAGEVGLLERIDESFVQLGPVVAIGGSGQTHDWEGEFDEWSISPRLRARMFMVDEWMTFEAAAGPTFLWTQGPRGEWLDRVGAYVEVGPSFHGAAGVYVGTGYIPASGGLGGEWRTTIGLRMNLAFSAALAAMTGILYACSESPGAC
jgi:hypothetical protein